MGPRKLMFRSSPKTGTNPKSSAHTKSKNSNGAVRPSDSRDITMDTTRSSLDITDLGCDPYGAATEGEGIMMGEGMVMADDEVSQLQFGESASFIIEGSQHGMQYQHHQQKNQFNGNELDGSSGLDRGSAENKLSRSSLELDAVAQAKTQAQDTTQAQAQDTTQAQAQAKAQQQSSGIRPLPPPPADSGGRNNKGKGGKGGFRRKNKSRTSGNGHHHSQSTNTNSNTNSSGSQGDVMPTEIRMPTPPPPSSHSPYSPTAATNSPTTNSAPHAIGDGRLGTQIVSDLERSAAEHRSGQSSSNSRRRDPSPLRYVSNTASSEMDGDERRKGMRGAMESDAVEGGEGGEEEAGKGKSRKGFGRRKSKSRQTKNQGSGDKKSNGTPKGNPQKGSPFAPQSPASTADSMEVLQQYELPSAVGYLSLILPVHESAPSSPQSNAALSSISSADWDDASVRTDARSVLTAQGTSAGERLRETIRCAQYDPASAAVAQSAQSSSSRDEVERTWSKVQEARRIGTVRTSDEDEEVYRALGPVDVDDDTFVREKGGGTAGSNTSTTDLWEAGVQGRQLVQQQRYDEAVGLYRFLLNRQKQELGPAHPIVASTHHNLQVIMTRKGSYADALGHCSEALRIRRSVAAKATRTSRLTATLAIAAALTEMGVVCYARDEFQQALKSLREALQITSNALGMDDPEVARILNAIGCVHYEMGKLVASAATFEESIDIQRTAMGTNAGGNDAEQALLNNATTLCNAGMVNVKQRKLDLSISMIEEGNMVIASVLGDEHPSAMNAAAILELLINIRDNAGEAESPNRNKVERLHLREVFGLNPSKLYSRIESALSRQSQDTGIYHTERIDIEADNIFSGNADGFPSRRSPANVPCEGSYDSLDRIELGSLRKELSSRERIQQTVQSSIIATSSLEDNIGDHSIPFIMPYIPDDRKKSSRVDGTMLVDVDGDIVDAELHLQSIYSNAIEHLRHTEYDEAIDLFESALQSHMGKYGKDHHLVGTALHNIGVIHLQCCRYGTALESFREAVNIRTRCLGEDHPAVVATLTKIGLTLAALGDFASSLVTFDSVIRIKQGSLGPMHPEIGKVVSNMACLYLEIGELDNAREMIKGAVEIDREHCSSQGYSTASSAAKLTLAHTLMNAGFIFVKCKEGADAIEFLQEALQILRSEDANTEITLECLATAMTIANYQSEEDDVEIGGKAREEMIDMYLDMLRE